MPRITYLSDIHLEFFKKSPNYHEHIKWEDGGDILCLAGDIGWPEQESYQKFIEYCSSKFKYVFVIAGNHEYYVKDTRKTIDEINQVIQTVCSSFSNVHFLNQTTFYIEPYDVYILGTTLWTTTRDDHEERMYYNDFKRIPEMAMYGHMDKLHEQSIKYLTTELEKQTTSTVIVMTHHLPSFDLIAHKFKGESLNYLFATHLNHMFKKYKIDHWICGHSHTPMNITIHNTQFHMNPLGYPGENMTIDWNASFDV